MRIVINILLFLLTIGLIYVLYSSIFEPIKFRLEKEKRERAVIDKLIEIRDAQNMYLDIKGTFATNFDSLKHVLTTGQFRYINIEGDPDDPDGDFIRDTSYSNSIDSIRILGIDLDALKTVPYGDGTQFTMFADTATVDRSLVNLLEVGSSYKSFMGQYGIGKYARYDKGYDPQKFLKFGDKNKPVLTGNWEQ